MVAGMEVEVELVLPIARPGFQVSVPIVAELAGELTLQDLDAPAAPKPENAPLMRIAERHRALARALAGGTTAEEAAVVFGYNIGTIYNLNMDPAFKNLVAFYQRSEDEIFRSTQARLTDVTHSALDLIEERLEDPEARGKVTIPQALAIAEMGADRTGHGPQSTSVAVNINAGLADRAKLARERAMASMRDITPKAANG